jgi:hypothetical protein
MLDEYSNIPFNPESMHCWGFVRFVYFDRSGTELIQFPYTNPKQNGELIKNVCATLPQCEPHDLAIFVTDSDEGDRCVGIIIEEDGNLYGCMMTNARSRVLSWEVCDRALKPICFSINGTAIDIFGDRLTFATYTTLWFESGEFALGFC